MSKRTLFLIFSLFIITLALLLVAFYQPQFPKTVPTASVPKEPVAQTTLSFGNPSIAASSSATTLNYSLPINILTSKNKVTVVQLELQYDPQVLADISVVPGPFFVNPNEIWKEIDIKTGRISYAFGVDLAESGVAGQGIAANLTFSVKSGILQETAIIFLPKTLVTAEGINPSVLKTTTNALFTVGVAPSFVPSAVIPSDFPTNSSPAQ